MNYISKLLRLLEEGAQVSTDTRTLQEGDIFFALKGENFNGNLYAHQALTNGASCAVIDDEGIDGNEKLLLVDDVLKTLQTLAREYRRKFKIPVIAITGSNGKTTTKELMHQTLSQKYRVHATSGNFNNQIGVPLTLLKLKSEHEIAIIEMGASELGEIAVLCQIAEPNAGIVTNVGTAHIEGFGSPEGVWETKAGLYEYLIAHEETAFFPSAIRQHPYFRKNYPDYGLSFSAEDLNGNNIKRVGLEKEFPFVEISLICSDSRTIFIQSNLFGTYNFENLVNVIKIADFYGLSPEQCKQGIEAYFPKNNRSQLIKDERGNTLVMDAYNANPSSVEKALEHVLNLDTVEKKIIVLGDMLELGEIEQEEHLKVTKQLLLHTECTVALVGECFLKTKESIHFKEESHLHFFEDAEQAKKWWEASSFSNKLVLVKGSRGIALEKIFN